jgi:hypothetical protein
MWRGYDVQQFLAVKAQVPEPPALYEPSAMYAAPRKNHVEFVAPELLENAAHRLRPDNTPRRFAPPLLIEGNPKPTLS